MYYLSIFLLSRQVADQSFQRPGQFRRILAKAVPAGSFYLYVKAPKASSDGTKFATGEDFSQWLIKTKLISSVPWDDVGPYVRFSATFVARGGKAEEDRVLAEFANRLADAKFEF